ncbi:hypothetical protein NQ314_001783 [Rhamnusium bicolor]|uniref:Uncharacterized protein n=1 Tax=Rhamnusium bicolor TaxID=1586634 RepID=A0AAV8ZRB6_9CUCU|nr:hypothetical protein NQ314_001783 [Rhamnusium bicolor]
MEDLKKSRGVIKGKLTRLNHFLEQIDRGHLDDSIISKLNVWLDKIEPCWDQFEEIQSQIEGLDDDTETSINEREQFENSYISVVGDVKALCAQYARATLNETNNSIQGFSNQVQQNRVEAASPDFTTAGGARSETPEDVNHQAGTSGVPGPNVSINSHSLNRIATAPVGSQILLATAIIKRVLAYVLRFINNARSTYNDRLFGALTPTELEGSLNSLIKGAQIECFPNEYHNLQNKRELSKKKINKLKVEIEEKDDYINKIKRTQVFEEEVIDTEQSLLSEISENKMIIKNFKRKLDELTHKNGQIEEELVNDIEKLSTYESDIKKTNKKMSERLKEDNKIIQDELNKKQATKN